MTTPQRTLLAAGLLLALQPSIPASAAAPEEALVEISAKELDEESRPIYLLEEWRFHPGDDPAFAAADFDDGAWQQVDTRLRAGERPAGWQGFGWFRLRFLVSPGLRGVPLALSLEQFGAAEIFLDGATLYAVGSADPRPEAARPRLQRRPHLFSFEDYDEHVLAVRFSNHDAGRFEKAGRLGGFELTVDRANRRISSWGLELRSLATHRAALTGLFAAFALLHLLLWVFYRQAAENLWFGLLNGIVTLVVYLFFRSQLTEDPRFFFYYERGMNAALLLLSAVALRFVYCIYERPPRRLYWALAAAAALLAMAWVAPAAAARWVVAGLLLASVEMVRTVIVAYFRGQAGARIVGAGILILAAGSAVGLLSSLGVVPSSSVTAFLIPAGSVLALVFTMSVYLSRRFAQTNLELRAKLHQVREQERQAREDEIARRLLEAENRRQAEELEVARQLQLSMLPMSLPVLPDLEIAAGMFTATEVGGDYYDFEVATDGTLTVAIGDATGHGMKAGTLVTATKSLFKALDAEAELPEALGRFGRALKRMNLHQLQMALTLARLQAGRLRLAAAGMPPVLVHRAISRRVESIQIDGMPLGGVADFPYRQSELGLDSGDTVLLMSDGFPERLNGDDEMLGYDKVRDAFARVAATAPQTIIDRLVADGEAWAGGKAAEDDITFVVLKMR